jgi:uncharacterized membrane protein
MDSERPATVPGVSSRFPLALVLALAAIGAAAAYIAGHWQDIPQRFPVGWHSDGLPRAYAPRTFAPVFGGLVLAASCVIALHLLLGWIDRWSHRRERDSEERFRFEILARRVARKATAFLQLIVACHAVSLALSPLSRKADAIFTLTFFLVVGSLMPIVPLMWRLGRSAPTRTAPPSGGLFWPFGYVDPLDPGLMAVGEGHRQTVNLGNAWNLVVLGFPMLVVVCDVLAYAIRE